MAKRQDQDTVKRPKEKIPEVTRTPYTARGYEMKKGAEVNIHIEMEQLIWDQGNKLSESQKWPDREGGAARPWSRGEGRHYVRSSSQSGTYKTSSHSELIWINFRADR